MNVRVIHFNPISIELFGASWLTPSIKSHKKLVMKKLTIGFSDLVRQNCHIIISEKAFCPIFSGQYEKVNYGEIQKVCGPKPCKFWLFLSWGSFEPWRFQFSWHSEIFQFDTEGIRLHSGPPFILQKSTEGARPPSSNAWSHYWFYPSGNIRTQLIYHLTNNTFLNNL